MWDTSCAVVLFYHIKSSLVSLPNLGQFRLVGPIPVLQYTGCKAMLPWFQLWPFGIEVREDEEPGVRRKERWAML